MIQIGIRNIAQELPGVAICTPFYVKKILIWTFPADPSTEYRVSLAKRVAVKRHPINLQLFNWRVPALVFSQPSAVYREREKNQEEQKLQ